MVVHVYNYTSERQSQEDHMFKTSLGYIVCLGAVLGYVVTPCVNKTTKCQKTI